MSGNEPGCSGGLLCRDDALAVLRRHAEHPSAYLSMNRGTLHFTTPGVDGLIAYRDAGKGHVLMAAGIHASIDARGDLLDRFIEWAHSRRRRVIAVQMLREDAELFARRGFIVNQIGASYSVTLDGYKLSGSPFIRLRNKISRARRSSVRIAEVGRDLPVSCALSQSIKEIDFEWLSSKGGKELKFLIGEVGELDQLSPATERLFVAQQDDRPVAYILYTASFGHYSGWMHDLTRRSASAAVGVMEMINAHAIDVFKAEGARMLNFGFTPLTSLCEDNEIKGSAHHITAWAFRKLNTHGRFIYPAQDQLQYKMKWAPDVVLTEYVAFERGAVIGSLWQFLRVTGSL